MSEADSIPVSIAIPTYRRGQVLLDTIESLLALHVRAAEILVVDQSESHDDVTLRALEKFDAHAQIRWLRLEPPSIPAAMNHALVNAANDVVLFLDDDIRAEPGLVAAHQGAQAEYGDGILVAGRVLQPWDEGMDFSGDSRFHFACLQPQWIEHFMGGNFSVRRSAALRLGGFDENFVRVAYRFEAEFAHRFRQAGGRIRYVPQACIHHLKAQAGGTRTWGEHLTTSKPDHAVGAYYFALRTRHWREFVRRPWQSIATRYHWRHPWRIPPTLLAEFRGMAWALSLHARGASYVDAARHNGARPPT